VRVVPGASPADISTRPQLSASCFHSTRSQDMYPNDPLLSLSLSIRLLPQKSEMNVLELNVIVDDCCTNELHKKAVMLNGCSCELRSLCIYRVVRAVFADLCVLPLTLQSDYITNVQASSYYGINPSAGAYVKPTGGATAVAAQQPHGIIVVKTADLITLAVYTAPTSPAAAVFVVEMFAAKLAEGGH